ncbi:MAG: ATP-binding protein [Alphaproteobacteria bacterium]
MLKPVKPIHSRQEADTSQRDMSAGSLPVVRWLTRSQWSVAILAIIAAFGCALLPMLAPEAHSTVVSLALVALLSIAAGATFWLLGKAREYASQEILLREAFHSVLTPQVITDAQGMAVLSNRAFVGWIDTTNQSAEAALAARFADNQAAANEFTQLCKTARNGQVAVAELPIMRGDKIVEWRRITTRQLSGWHGYLQWRFEDVSERRRMERAMREEQAKLVDFMTNAPVGIYSIDQHGRFRFVNRTLGEWLGCAPEELINNGVRLHEVICSPPKNAQPYAFAAGPHGEQNGEAVMRNRDGVQFPVAITQTVVVGDDGKTLRTRSVVRDLRPEREWQQALSASEQRFQRLFAEAPIGVALLNPNLRITECNESLQKLLRRARTTLIDLPLADLLQADARTATIDQLHEALSGKDVMRPIEAHMIGGRHVITLIYVKQFEAPARTPGGASEKGLVLYFIDITDQKKMEMQFSQSQKMQAIGQLAGGIAHDFNNLLTAMIGFCDLLLQRHKPGDQSFADIMQIKQNGNRAANLVRQLLAFSRQQTLQPKLLNLVDVLAELSNLLRRLIGSGVSLRMVHGRALHPILVDQGQLEQVVINLVVNARDAMPKGGTVTVKTFNHHQDMPVVRGQDDMPAGDYVAIEVADIGIGIPPQIMERIFEPFFSTKEVGQGTGLGLSTVYGIVRQTGGFIDVQTHLGQGTKFIVYLPTPKEGAMAKAVAAAANDSEDNKERAGSDLTGAGTILLVEDEDAVRIFSSRALRNKGYMVLEARNGEEAIAVVEKEGAKIDLLISDVVMPQMDGPTMIAIVREKRPDLKVIFISGYTEDKFRDQLKEGEVVHFLGKPFTLKQLASKVKDVLSGEA